MCGVCVSKRESMCVKEELLSVRGVCVCVCMKEKESMYMCGSEKIKSIFYIFTSR